GGRAKADASGRGQSQDSKGQNEGQEKSQKKNRAQAGRPKRATLTKWASPPNGPRVESPPKTGRQKHNIWRRNRMKSIRNIVGVIGVAMPLMLGAGAASAEDTLKVVIGQINNWENQAPTLGQDAGIFKKHGLVLENTGTQGAGETIQAVISGSADIGAGVGAAGVMRAFSKGAPVRILAPAFTGTGDLYWYVKSDSKIQSLKDTTPETTIAYSTNGSSSNNIVVAFVSELGAKAKPTATGGPAATLTAVMSGQVDIGWAAPPFGLRELKEGKIRIVAKGSDVPSLRGQTVRTLIV